jgi:hypothetical protein
VPGRLGSDFTSKTFPVGRIGMYVSSKSQKDLSPLIADWLIERSADTKNTKKQASEPQASELKSATAKKTPPKNRKRFKIRYPPCILSIEAGGYFLDWKKPAAAFGFRLLMLQCSSNSRGRNAFDGFGPKKADCTGLQYVPVFFSHIKPGVEYAR